MRSIRSMAVVGLVLAASCHAHRRVEAPSVEPTPEGRTSVRVLNAPEPAPGRPDPWAERITPAYASPENRLPQYPPYALKAGCREGTVPVRVHVGMDGNVTAQRDIPDRPLPEDLCHMAFRAAVQGTVNDWKFAPAFRQRPLEPQDGMGRRGPPLRWEQEAVAIYLDYEFLFEVVGGKGVVRTR